MAAETPKVAPCAAASANAARALSAPSVKFSDDIERLQCIDRIRKAPVAAQIKRVTGLLLSTRQALTPEQINQACYVDVNANKAVFNSLTNNPIVNYDGKCFSYKSTYSLNDIGQLRALILKNLEGLPVIDLKDAYPNVMEDLQALKAAGDIWLISNSASQDGAIAYPNEPKLSSLKVDDDLKTLFRKTELPCDMIDIEEELRKTGRKPATDTAKRIVMAIAHGQGISSNSKPMKKKREISKRTKITNAHLPELFQ